MNRKAAMRKNLVFFETGPFGERGKGDWRAGRSKPLPGETGFFPRQKGTGGFWPDQRIYFPPFPPEKRGHGCWPLFAWKIREKILLLMQEFAKM
jgi:hypothetical protein